jgi:hypothetical protein
MSISGPKRMFIRFVTIVVMMASSIAAVDLAAPSPASAADSCVYGWVCWYYVTNQNGTRCSRYTYTRGWVNMGCLVDDSESSFDAQFSDPAHCVNDLNPFVYLSDTYLTTRWIAQVGSFNGDHRNTFNPVYTNYGWLNMNDRFNDIWNLCA